MNVQSFTLLGNSVLEQVQATLARAADGWAGEWGVAAPTLRAERAFDAGMPAAAVWSGLRGQDGAVWFAWDAQWHAELQKMMFAGDGTRVPQSEQPPQLAPAAARKAGDALADALVKSLLSAATPALDMPAAALWARGAGAVMVTLQMGKLESRLLLDAACVRALCPQPKPVLPALSALDLRAALDGTPVALALTVGAARVGLGSLLSLEVGDVIRLDSAIDAPLAMTLPSGAPLFSAYLGKIGDGMAVELAGLK